VTRRRGDGRGKGDAGKGDAGTWGRGEGATRGRGDAGKGDAGKGDGINENRERRRSRGKAVKPRHNDFCNLKNSSGVWLKRRVHNSKEEDIVQKKRISKKRTEDIE